MALIQRRADHRVRADTSAGLAGIGLRTGIAVVAGRSVGFRRLRATASRDIARAYVVTLIQRRADHWVRADASAGLARIGLRTGIAVVAGRAVRLRRLRATASRDIARAYVVTLIQRRADHWVRADASAGLAGIGLRTGIAVVAGRSVRCVRI